MPINVSRCDASGNILELVLDSETNLIEWLVGNGKFIGRKVLEDIDPHDNVVFDSTKLEQLKEQWLGIRPIIQGEKESEEWTRVLELIDKCIKEKGSTYIEFIGD